MNGPTEKEQLIDALWSAEWTKHNADRFTAANVRVRIYIVSGPEKGLP